MNLHSLVKFAGYGTAAITIIGLFFLLISVLRADKDASDPKLLKTLRTWLVLCFVCAIIFAGCVYTNIRWKRLNIESLQREWVTKVGAAHDEGAAKIAALTKECEARVAALQKENGEKIEQLNRALAQVQQQADAKLGAVAMEKQEQENAVRAKIAALQTESAAALAKLAAEKQSLEKELLAKVDKVSADAQKAAMVFQAKLKGASVMQADFSQALAAFQAELAGPKAKVEQLRKDLDPLLAKNRDLSAALGAGK